MAFVAPKGNSQSPRALREAPPQAASSREDSSLLSHPVLSDSAYQEFSTCLLRCDISQLLITELGDDLLLRLVAFLSGSSWGELKLVKAEGKIKEVTVSEVIRKPR